MVTYDSNLLLWEDPWLENRLILSNYLTDLEIVASRINLNAKVGDFIQSGVICLPRSSVSRINQLWTKARKVKVKSVGGDLTVWCDNGNGFQIKRLYNFFAGIDTIPRDRWSSKIWTKDISARENLLLWKVIHKAIFTTDKLSLRGVQCGLECVFYSNQNESVDHLFFQCQFVFVLWNEVMTNIGRKDACRNAATQWNILLNQTGRKRPRGRLLNFVLKRFLHTIWRERNAIVFNVGCAKSKDQIRKNIKTEIRERVFGC